MKSLIVEDEFTSRRILQRILEGYGECDIAVDGVEGVTAFHAALLEYLPYDLVVLDIKMPRMDGLEALRQIRSIEEEHDIGGLDGVKVIITTVLDDGESVFGAFRIGCEAYLVKPVDKQKLIKEMKTLGVIGKGNGG